MFKYLICTIINSNDDVKKQKEMKNVIKFKRSKINYYVNQLEYLYSIRIKRWYFWTYFILFLVAEIFLFVCHETPFESVIIGLVIPIVLAGLVGYTTSIKDCYVKALDIEKELIDILKYIELNDNLKENEMYLLSYIDSNIEKYNKKNKFDSSRARSA